MKGLKEATTILGGDPKTLRAAIDCGLLVATTLSDKQLPEGSSEIIENWVRDYLARKFQVHMLRDDAVGDFCALLYKDITNQEEK